MRLTKLGWALGLIIFFNELACTPNQTKDIATSDTPFSVDSVFGYWMVTAIGVQQTNTTLLPNDKAKLAQVLSDLKYVPLHFSNTGSLTQTNNIDFKLKFLNWSFTEPDTLLIHGDSTQQFFLVKSYKNGFLETECLPNPNLATKPKARLFCTFCRIRPEKEGITNLFSESLSMWRNPCDADASHDEIKARLKSLLLYNAAYIRGIFYSSYQAINTKHLNLPFDYYRGGMVLKPLQECINFQMLFGVTKTNTYAYSLLEEASKRSKYPRIPQNKNYILEYATYMELLAKNL